MTDDRPGAIAAKVRTMRALEAFGGRGQDPLGLSPGYVIDAAEASDRLVKAIGEVSYVYDTFGAEPAARVVRALAHVVLDNDPDGFAAALHLIHGRRIDVPTFLEGHWFFVDAATTWEDVEALLAADTESRSDAG
jgi:hypothetical protein